MIRLGRSLPGRLWGGARVQPLVLTFVVLGAIRVIGLAAGVLDDQVGGTASRINRTAGVPGVCRSTSAGARSPTARQPWA
jgi:hypothetical protein